MTDRPVGLCIEGKLMTTEMETKDRIMRAAFELFSSRGYSKVSLNDVISKAGVSKGGLFHYFDSKYSLGRDCLFQWADEHMSLESVDERSVELKPDEILVHFIDSMIELMVADSSLMKFFWSMFDEAMTNKKDLDIWIQFLERYITFVESAYRDMGVKDPRMKALILLSNLDGITLYYSILRETDSNIDLEALKNELIRTYVTFDEVIGNE